MGTGLPLQHHPPHQCRRRRTPTHVLLTCNDKVPQFMSYLALKRITPANPFRFDQSKVFRVFNNRNSDSCAALEITTMTDKAEKNNESQSVGGESSILNGKKEGEKELEKSTPKNIPPPPEKPLPDDCCGSGCVRCVWDIYYDELEEYNKLYKNKQS